MYFNSQILETATIFRATTETQRWGQVADYLSPEKTRKKNNDYLFERPIKNFY